MYVCMYTYIYRERERERERESETEREAVDQSLEKGLDFAPVQNKINKSEFARRMKTKSHFENEPTLFFSQSLAFKPRST